MHLFKRKQNAHIGVDFGAGGMKVLQLQGSRPKLFTYGFIEHPHEEIGKDYLENLEATGDLLKAILVKARTTTVVAHTALPIPAVFSTVIGITPVPKKELRQAVEWEAKKLVPLPLEEVVLDFKVLSTPRNGTEGKPVNKEGGTTAPAPASIPAKEGKVIEVLLTAAPKSIIDRYVRVAKHAGLTLASLETEAFALIRALLGADPTPTIIVDLGAVRSNILIVDRSVPFLSRSVEIGGEKCTKAIAEQLQMTLPQAEEMKRAGTGALPPVLQNVLQPLINEMKYSLTVYESRSTLARMPERIILTGGGAGLSGLPEFIMSHFNIRTFVGNPWERVSSNPDLAPILARLGPKFAVSIGLGLRNYS